MRLLKHGCCGMAGQRVRQQYCGMVSLHLGHSSRPTLLLSSLPWPSSRCPYLACHSCPQGPEHIMWCGLMFRELLELPLHIRCIILSRNCGHSAHTAVQASLYICSEDSLFETVSCFFLQPRDVFLNSQAAIQADPASVRTEPNYFCVDFLVATDFPIS